jgi:NADH-quinone oxidoreductase subunit A
VLSEYLPILVLFVIAAGFAGLSVGAASFLGPSAPNPTKLSAYECGNEPLANVKETRFSVQFYLVAMMFLIFDIETVFLYPWAVVYRSLGWFAVAQMSVFFVILGVAFVYEIGRGGLSWIQSSSGPSASPPAGADASVGPSSASGSAIGGA